MRFSHFGTKLSLPRWCNHSRGPVRGCSSTLLLDARGSTCKAVVVEQQSGRGIERGREGENAPLQVGMACITCTFWLDSVEGPSIDRDWLPMAVLDPVPISCSALLACQEGSGMKMSYISR